VILAREAGLGRELLAAIQRAYYAARNPVLPHIPSWEGEGKGRF